MNLARTSKPDPPTLSEAPLRSFPIEAGCIVLFSGLTDLEGKIQHALDNIWTRCALVVRVPWGTPVLLQATSRPISNDLVVGQTLTGVQIIAIDEVLSRFEGFIGLRSLRPKLSQNNDARLTAFAMASQGSRSTRARITRCVRRDVATKWAMGKRTTARNWWQQPFSILAFWRCRRRVDRPVTTCRAISPKRRRICA